MYRPRLRNLITLHLVPALFLLLVPAAAPATVINVDIAGGGDYTQIKPAVEAAASGDTVLIAPGYYQGAENRGMDLEDKNLVIVGTAGPDLTTIYCAGQARGFTIAGGQDSTCVIEGLKIASGRGSVGGGAYCLGSSPVFRNCIFHRCFSRDYSGNKGGGVYCEAASPVFEDCTFWYCIAGGEHYPDGQGAGAYAIDSSPTFLRCTFDECRAEDGSGGGFHGTNSTSYFEGCLFRRNRGTLVWCYGGGAFISGGSATFKDVFFDRNSAYRGGGVRFLSASATFEEVVFYSNYGSIGGGGVSCEGGGPYTFTNVTFWENESFHEGGGGLHYVQSTGSLDQCTFWYNDAPVGSGILAGESSQFSVTRTILAFSEEGAPIDCDGTLTTVTHCCSYGNAGGDSLCGDYYDNMFEPPSFCDPQAGDFTLFNHSPCLPENNAWGELIGAHDLGCVYDGPPDPPTGLELSTDDQTCYVSWDPVSNDYLDHYRIERDTSAAFGAGTAVATSVITSFVDSPLENWREYFYRVFAADTLGGLSGPGDTASIVIHAVPPVAPTGVSVVDVGHRVVDLDWSPVYGHDVSYYAVYRDTQPGVSEDDMHALSAVSSLSDTAVANYVSYYYRMSAIDTGGLVSELSDEVRGVPHGTPPTVTGLVAFPGASSAVLEWEPVSPACQLHYNVYRDTVPSMHSPAIFSDGFETYEVGSPPTSPPWSTSQQTDTAVRVSDVFAATGSRSLAVADSSVWSSCRLFHWLPDTTSIAPYVTFSMRPGALGVENNLIQCELLGERGMGYPVVMLEVFDDSLRHWVSGSDPVALAYCQPEEWHTIECRVDCAADAYSVWLDSECVTHGAGFFNDARYLDIIQFRSRGGELGRAWLDDILWADLVDIWASTEDVTFVDEPLEEGKTYYYAVAVVDTFGIEGPRSEIAYVTPGCVGIAGEETPVEASLALKGSNPFRSGIALAYAVPEPGALVTIRLYSVSGRLVRVLVDTHSGPGVHHVTWGGLADDGRPVASGVYFCRATVGEWTETAKLTLIR